MSAIFGYAWKTLRIFSEVKSTFSSLFQSFQELPRRKLKIKNLRIACAVQNLNRLLEEQGE